MMFFTPALVAVKQKVARTGEIIMRRGNWRLYKPIVKEPKAAEVQTAYLTLIRHGKSTANVKNEFAGLIDVPLAPQGEQEAKECALLLGQFGVKYDAAYTSALVRAQDTLKIIMEDNGWKMPVHEDSAINERDYGEWQGKNKDDICNEYGPKKFQKVRRGYRKRPPGGESLKDTAKRAWPYFVENILQHLKDGENVLVSAHGNSLRAIIMMMEELTDDKVAKLEVPTGVPYVYKFSQGGIVAKTMLGYTRAITETKLFTPAEVAAWKLASNVPYEYKFAEGKIAAIYELGASVPKVVLGDESKPWNQKKNLIKQLI
ncbi:MAG: 2,3-diphosphoglycerate-dependent phosphoglycerate mutase [Candidatus Micrarchaeota archaeon]